MSDAKSSAGRAAGSPDKASGRRRASGIYGTIVTAAVIAAAGNVLKTRQLVVAIVVTLLVYWLAEQYAALLGEHTRAGHLPTRPEIGAALGESWPMVSASYLPVAVLLVARLFGASRSVAAYVALAVTIVLLVFYGWRAGRVARLTGWRLVTVTATAAVLGGIMVGLKVLLKH